MARVSEENRRNAVIARLARAYYQERMMLTSARAKPRPQFESVQDEVFWNLRQLDAESAAAEAFLALAEAIEKLD